MPLQGAHQKNIHGVSRVDLDPGTYNNLLVPKPLVLVSTVDKHGVSNVSPASSLMPASYKPPRLCLGISHSHDTLANIREVGDFVVNVVPADLLEKAVIASKPYPRGESEFQKAGLTEEKSSKVKSPRVAESPVCFECRTVDTFNAGDHILILGEVVAVQAKPEALRNNLIDETAVKPVAHIATLPNVRIFANLEKTYTKLKET